MKFLIIYGLKYIKTIKEFMFALIQGNFLVVLVTFGAGYRKCAQTVKETTAFFVNISKMLSMSLKRQTYININFQIIYGEFI